MHALIAALVISLLSVWSIPVSGQPSPEESPATQALALTQDQIKQAQEFLKMEGFNPGSVDGVVGAQTRRALRDYQAKAGLAQTGILDEPTFHRLAPRAPCEQVGLASWYGTAREGRQTSGGERFSAGP